MGPVDTYGRQREKEKEAMNGLGATTGFPSPPATPGATRSPRIGGEWIALGAVGLVVASALAFGGGFVSRNGEVHDLTAKLDAARGDIASLNYNLSDARGKLTDAQGQVVRLQDTVSSLQAQVDRL